MNFTPSVKKFADKEKIETKVTPGGSHWFDPLGFNKPYGYSKRYNISSNLPEPFKKKLAKKIYINSRGVVKHNITSRSDNKQEIADEIGLPLISSFPIETETIDRLKKALDKYAHERQKKVSYQNTIYKIDYFINVGNIGIAVECDEHDHVGRTNEKKRQDSIQEILNCWFIRFDPHHQNFTVDKLIAVISSWTTMIEFNISDKIKPTGWIRAIPPPN